MAERERKTKQDQRVLTMKKSTIAKIYSIGFAAAISVNAFAATNDSGPTAESTATSDISLSVIDAVKVTGVADVPFGDYGATDTGAVSFNDSFCVYRNGGDPYGITPSIDGKEDLTFKLYANTEGNTDVLEFTLKLDDSQNASSGTPQTPGAKQTFASGSTTHDCDSGDNTAFHIDITEEELREATTDDYTATLVMVVSPE